MQFDTDYFAALDKKAREINYDLHNIGISHGVGDVTQGLRANIFRGATQIELGFMGAGKGSRSSPTGINPESYGANERREMAELARVNEVELTTHASPNIGAISGFREGRFSEEQKEFALHEIKRAIEFAADTAGGGPVVFHFAEFPREIFSAGGEKGRFKSHPTEEQNAPVYIVDKRTGALQAIPRNQEIPLPAYKDKEHKELDTTEDGTAPKIRMLTYNTFEQEARDQGIPEQKIVQEFIKELNKGNIETAHNMQYHAFERHKQLKEEAERLEKLKQNAEKILRESTDKTTAESTVFHRLQKSLFGEASNVALTRPDEFEKFMENPIKYVQERIDETKRSADIEKEGAIGYGRTIEETKARVDNTVDVREYGVEATADGVARAALYAYEVEKKKDLDKTLWVAPENWAVETYGSHPQEYKELILKSREHFANILQQKKGLSEQEAEKEAAERIKGTFDIGHINFWRKLHQGSDEEFNEWLVSEVKQLAKEGIVGHVHLSDNFGFYDEHLEIGEGNAPIQEFMKAMKDIKFKGKMVSEPGGQRQGHEHRVWTSALRVGGSPIYRVDTRAQIWSDIEGSYFGRTQSPNFLVGEYAPSKDWTLWSEIPFE